MVLRFVIDTAEFLRRMPVKWRPEKVVSKVKSHLGSLYEEESCHGQKGHSAKGIKLTAKTVDEDPASYIRLMG